MKLIHILSLFVAALFFAGCASNSGSGSSAAEEAPAAGDSSMSGSGEKTAYDGATGSGLLMERYKTGRIEGYRE